MPELMQTNPENNYGIYKSSAQNHNYVIEIVVNTLNNKSTITTNALVGVEFVEIIEKIYSNF